MQTMKIEGRLRCELAEHPQEVMVIVGAGVTMGAVHGSDCQTRASWGGLLRHGFDYAVGLGLLEPDEAADIVKLLDHAKPRRWISAAEELCQALRAPHGGEFRAWLREAVGPLAESIRDRSVLDVLADLHRQGATLVTVNYDSVLEAATGLRPVTWLESSAVERVLRHRAKGILHLHGHWERPESVVLGASSYAEVVADPHARAVLESMRMYRTLVFVGHGAGLRDPNWSSFLDWTAEVFYGAEFRHYRIVLESDMEELRDPDQQDRRILPVPYPGTYADLGPFLRSLVPEILPGEFAPDRLGPPSESPEPAQPAVRYVLLQVDIGTKNYEVASAEEIQKFAKLPDIAEMHAISRTLDLRAARARHWREIAKDLDRLLETAREVALRSPKPITFVISGRAPLPVFAYLGYHSKRLNGRVMLVNQQDARWDQIGPFSGMSDFPASTRRAFKAGADRQFQTDPGALGLFIGCSTGYSCADEALRAITKADGRALSALYRIEGILNHMHNPLNQGDLASLSSLLLEVLMKMAGDHPKSRGLVLAVGGPTWVAFWIGRMLNTNVVDLIDMPNFIRGLGYRRALASRMEELRWVHDVPEVLALSAEPDKEARIRAGEAQDALLDAIEKTQGQDARRRVLTVNATKVSGLVQRLATVQADILHIYAHGGADGTIGFQDDRGLVVAVSADDFAAAVRATQLFPSLAVAVACHSASLVPALLEVAELVVAVDDAVRFRTAVEFIRSFYLALGRGSSVQTAFKQAKSHVDLQPGHTSEAFLLRYREGIDPDDAVFWPSR